MGNTCSSSPDGISSGAQRTVPLSELIEQLKPEFEKNGASNQLGNLIAYIDQQIAFLEAMNPNAQITATDSVRSDIELVSKIVNGVSTRLHQPWTKLILEAMRDEALEVVKLIGNQHWAVLALAMVAFVLQRFAVCKAMNEELLYILKQMGNLAKNVEKLWNMEFEDNKKQLQNALQVIVEGVLICDVYISLESCCWRFLSASTVKQKLQEIRKKLTEQNTSLSNTVNIEVLDILKKNVAEGSTGKWPEKPPNFRAVGIDDRREEVNKLLNMEGEETVLSVAICGFAGAGKTHLAQSVIYSLRDEYSSKFKFCRVDVQEETVDNQGGKSKTVAIKKLQKAIISSLSGKAKQVQSADEGRNMIANSLKGRHCFIFINNAQHKGTIQQILPESLPSFESMNSSAAESTKVRILITCRERHFKSVLGAECKVFDTETLNQDASQEMLSWKITKGKEDFKYQEDEKDLIQRVAEECRGVPLYMDLFGEYLHDWREEKGKHAYQNVLQVLRSGNLSDFGDETVRNNALTFVIDNLRSSEWREAFLDICMYYYDWSWLQVSCILGENCLDYLKDQSLIKHDSDDIVVHDLLLNMGRNRAEETRIDQEGFLKIQGDPQKLQSVKGLDLFGKALIKIEASDLETMRNSLRYLNIDGCVSISKPCTVEFKELRHMKLGDVEGFPFQNSTQLPMLKSFELASIDINMSQVLRCPALEYLTFDSKNLDSFGMQQERKSHIWQRLKKLPLHCLEGLSPLFTGDSNLQTQFHQSMQSLNLTGFEGIPEIGNLKDLQELWLADCAFQTGPQVSCDLPILKDLTLQWCKKLKCLQISRFRKLEYLNLQGCISLEELPEDIGNAEAMEFLDLSWCLSLRKLPESVGKLKSLVDLTLTGCIKLEKLPDSLSELQLKYLGLIRLDSLKEIPSAISKMMVLESLDIVLCKAIKKLPDEFVCLRGLKNLRVNKCNKLMSLPGNFNELESLEDMELSACENLKELPQGIERLPALKSLKVGLCKHLYTLPESFQGLELLENLVLKNLPIQKLPLLGPSNKLKFLKIQSCKILKQFPNEIILNSARKIAIKDCSSVPGEVLDSILHYPRCVAVNIRNSTELLQRWKSVQGHNSSSTLVIQSSKDPESRCHVGEWQEAVTATLLQAPCIESGTGGDVQRYDQLPLSGCTSVALVCVPQKCNAFHLPLSQSQQEPILAVFFKRVEHDVEDTDVEGAADERLLNFMSSCGTRAVAILGREIKRRLCLEYLFFNHQKKDIPPDGAACQVARLTLPLIKVQFQLEFHYGQSDGTDAEVPRTDALKEQNEADDNVEKSTVISFKDVQVPYNDALEEGQDEVDDDVEESNGISWVHVLWYMKKEKEEEYKIRYQSDREFFLNALKQEKQQVLVDKDRKKADIYEMLASGEKFCIYQTPQLKMWDFVVLKHLARNMKMKIVWIAHFNEDSDGEMGCGSYQRMIRLMPESCWALEYPLPCLVQTKAPTLCYVDDKGQATPDIFKAAVLYSDSVSVDHAASAMDQILGGHHIDNTSSWQLLVRERRMEGKLVLVLAFPFEEATEWQQKLMQVMQLIEPHAKLEIVYVGYPLPNYCCDSEWEGYDSECEEGDSDWVASDVYDKVTKQIAWPALAFEDMVLFWQREIAMLDLFLSFSGQFNLGGSHSVSPSSAHMLPTVRLALNATIVRTHTLSPSSMHVPFMVLLDQDANIVTKAAEYVVYKILLQDDSSNQEYSKIVREELMKCISRGKCSDLAKTLLSDEVTVASLHEHRLQVWPITRELQNARYEANKDMACHACGGLCDGFEGAKVMWCQSCQGCRFCEQCWMPHLLRQAMQEQTQIHHQDNQGTKTTSSQQCQA